ncbi:FAD-dependent oxidoreductase, partial [Escherichia coli]
LGVKLYEHTPLTTVTDEGSTVFVKTPKGSVRAPRVVFGSGTAKVGIPDINRRVMQVRDHVLATEPLTDEQLAR